MRMRPDYKQQRPLMAQRENDIFVVSIKTGTGLKTLPGEYKRDVFVIWNFDSHRFLLWSHFSFIQLLRRCFHVAGNSLERLQKHEMSNFTSEEFKYLLFYHMTEICQHQKHWTLSWLEVSRNQKDLISVGWQVVVFLQMVKCTFVTHLHFFDCYQLTIVQEYNR